MVVSANKETGLGHWYRCSALLSVAFNRGHKTALVGDRKPSNSTRFYSSAYLNEDSFVKACESFQPNWIVIDIPDKIPDWMWQTSAKKCVIDGIGHETKEKAELNISQGFDGEYCAPVYLILRQHMMISPALPKPREGMFVFGGGADKLGLAKRFVQSCKEIPANIVISPMVDWIEVALSQIHTLYTMDDNHVFSVMKASTGAAAHMGMICWELCRDNIAPHIFSYSVGHLESAKELERRGYALAYDMIGLPENDETLLDFLNRPAVFNGQPIDGWGAERVIRLMERK